MLCDIQEARVGAGRDDRFEESGEGVTELLQKVGRLRNGQMISQHGNLLEVGGVNF